MLIATPRPGKLLLRISPAQWWAWGCARCIGRQMFLCLSKRERNLHDFFAVHLAQTSPLVFIEFVDVVVLARPQVVHISAAGFKPRGTFFPLTDPS
eukprot:2543862-Alexandrium_andersonii.AAC.1